MATRFYLPISVMPSSVAPAYSASWEETSSSNRYRLYNFPTTSSSGTTIVATHSVASVGDVLVAQFISEPLAAQTITGTTKGIIRVLESASANDCRAQMVMKVVSNDGSTTRGTLLAEDAGALSNEFPITTLTNRKFPLNWAGAGTALGSVAAQDGDRLVIEIGARFHVATTSITASFRIGDDSSLSDAAENETATTNTRSWIELSQDLIFNRTVNVSEDSLENTYTSDLSITKDAYLSNLCGTAGTVANPIFYIMRGRDVDCGTPTYRIWSVTDEPDITGTFYSGPKCGASALSDIVVIKKVEI